MPQVSSFTIVYDAECGLCTSTKDWIGQQVPLVGLQFVCDRFA
jgi:predicted DCC family thiol-disulfide oxidoreductase YuxK